MSETPDRKLVDHDAYGTFEGGRFPKVWELPDGSLGELSENEARKHIPWEVTERRPSIADKGGPARPSKSFGEA